MVITDKPGKLKVQWIRYVILGVVCALLSWCALVEQLRPLGPVLLCAVIDNRKYFACAFAGALLGAVLAGFDWAAVALNCLPVIITALLLLLLTYLGRKKYIYKCGAVLTAYGLTAVIAPAVQYDYILLALNAAAACGLIPLAQTCVGLLKTGVRKKERLSPRELVSLNIGICLAILALPHFEIIGLSPVAVLGCAYIVLSGVLLGAGGGAAAGSLLAFLAAFKTGSYELALVFASGGMLAGLLKDMRRAGPPLGMLMADIIFTLMLRRDIMPILSVQALIIGALPVILMPENIYIKLCALFASSRTGINLAVRLKEENAQKLSEISGVLADVGRIFKSSQTDAAARKAALCGIAASEVCSQCDKYDYCWRSRYADTYGDFKQLAALVYVVGTVSPCDVPVPLKGRCHYWVQVLISMNTHNELLLGEETEKKESTIALECESISRMLDALTAENLTEAEYDEKLEGELASALKERGIETREVICRKSGAQTEIKVVRPACRSGRECSSAILSELKRLTGVQFICDYRKCNAVGEKCVCSFIPLPRLRVSGYAARQKKEGERVCGDTFALKPIKGGKYLAAISDGMGSGSGALAESERAVSLAETLLEGGMDSASSYSLINQLLYLGSQKESYSTLDACVLDLNDGVMEWGKIGACPGYILREGKAISYECASLPAGIVDSVHPGIIKKLIRSGDVIILVSDGVYDALSGAQDGIKSYLEDNEELDSENLAKGLIEKALEAYSGQAKDDMTALAIRISA